MARGASSGIINDKFLNADGSVRHVGLAHKNLNNVYGKVRTKFNQQIRQGGVALKNRPPGGAVRNNAEGQTRFIAGMTYN